MTFIKPLLLTILFSVVSSLSFAEEVPIKNFSTDNRLISEVKTRMVLENGLVVHIWKWNEKANELGMGELPPAGLIAQDVELMYPEAVIKDENGYLVVDLPVLMDQDDLIAKLVLEGGVARLVQSGGGGADIAAQGGIGVVTATITETDMTTLAGLTSTAGVFTISVTDATVAAAAADNAEQMRLMMERMTAQDAAVAAASTQASRRNNVRERLNTLPRRMCLWTRGHDARPAPAGLGW